ncbi:hypothetical protein B0T24DRAFT_204147 [Lasiosphaeria ovina]|uniref:CCHC-type domain-containing protein n=1 Tax=Lasiosphaeria ovina TaxID=92902 RepID=A0AAE0KFM7_9PEZI|nr:hypothetical protein B0T24DRAFT_204147 [Lasiosphaeria ovina]
MVPSVPLFPLPFIFSASLLGTTSSGVVLFWSLLVTKSKVETKVVVAGCRERELDRTGQEQDPEQELGTVTLLFLQPPPPEEEYNPYEIMSSLSRRACYKCGELGHHAEACSSPHRLCYNCKQPTCQIMNRTNALCLAAPRPSSATTAKV